VFIHAFPVTGLTSLTFLSHKVPPSLILSPTGEEVPMRKRRDEFLSRRNTHDGTVSKRKYYRSIVLSYSFILTKERVGEGVFLQGKRSCSLFTS
jgi:hypothetical protein